MGIKRGDWVMVDADSPLFKIGIYPPKPFEFNRAYQVKAVYHEKDSMGHEYISLQSNDWLIADGKVTMQLLKKLDKKYEELAKLLYG